MHGWVLALLAATLSGQALPGVVTETTGPDAYRLTVTTSDAVDPEEARRRLVQTAERLCGDKPVQFGRYVFEADQPLSGRAVDKGQLKVQQELTCGGPVAAPEPHGPLVEQREDRVIRSLTENYFGALNRGDFQRAYAMTSPGFHGGLSLTEWTAAERNRQAAAGGSEQRRVAKITWYDNPDGAERPGTYVAVDFTGSAEKTAVECGYVVWYHEGGGRFRLIRQETNNLPKAQADQMTPAQLEELKASFRCAS